ncbi:MAG: class A beta-lactamase-related serine hydrolase [Ignavibacteria bacterium]|nr:class A beta-lactamase-related serine hydrolase [Ignavibacteria bacterium]
MKIHSIIFSILVLYFNSLTYSFDKSSHTDNANELRYNQNVKIDSIIKSKISSFSYPIGIVFQDLNDEEKFFYNEKEIFPTASAIKIEILLHLFKEYERGKLNIYKMLPVNYTVGGSGLIQYFDINSLRLSYYNLAVLMIQQSDNTATNILIDALGMENINRTIQELGLFNTKLQRKMMDFAARKAGKENLSTPEDKLKLLNIIYNGKFLSDSLNKEVIKILSIPKQTPLLEGIDDEITLASKGGELDDVRCEMGIYYHKNFKYILVIMTKNLSNSKIGEEIIGSISKAIFDYMKMKYHR